MQNSIRTIATAAILLCIHAAPGAQPADSSMAVRPPHVFGIGVALDGATVYTDRESIADYIPANSASIRFPLEVGASSRLEPEIGYYRLVSEHYGDHRGTSSNLLFAVGAFGLIRRGTATFSFGARVGAVRSSYSRDRDWGDDSDSKTDISIGPVIGAELRAHEHFSIGVEVGVNYVKIGDFGDGSSNGPRSLISTRTAIVVRWFY